MKSSLVRRIVVAVAGGAVLVVGLITIPYPGPGWLIVFAGLGILSTEFQWAKRLLSYARGKYDGWQDWIKKQPFIIKACFWVLTFVIVIATIWLLNGYGLINDWLDLGYEWAKSPLVR